MKDKTTSILPRLTVLMPVYNGEEFLRDTMDSVLGQTYTDFVFLIINDGSTDKSEEIILSYTDTRIKYLKNIQNIGLVATLNKGIELTDTEYLARMDADDLWNIHKLEKQMNVLDNNSGLGICGTSIRKFGAFEADFIFPVSSAGLRVGFLFYCTMSHPSVIFRMSFLRTSGMRYRPDYFLAEDYKMWIDCIDKTEIYNIPEILVYYRQHASQVTQTKNPKQINLVNAIRVEMLEKVSSDFSSDEKSFHNDVFINGSIQSGADLHRFKKWCKILQHKNRIAGNYLDNGLLKTELNNYIQVRYKQYILQKYFKQFTFQSFIRYFLSMEWTRLSLKRNIKLLLKKA